MHLKWEKKIYRLCTVAVGLLLLFAVVGAIWNLSLFLFNADVLDNFKNQMAASGTRDLSIWLFKDNALTTGFVVFSTLVFLLTAAIAVAMGLKKDSCHQTVLPERRGALQFIRIFTGFALLAVPILFAVFYFYGFDLGKFNSNMNLFAMLCALPGSLYFLFPGITDRFSEFLQTLFGICFIGFTIFSLVTTHVYMYEGLTSPVRACNLLSLTAMMLFVLYEVRFLASKPLPGMYVASAGAALYFCGINCLPRLILTLLGEMSVGVQTMYAFLELMIAIYAACRLLLFLSEWRFTIKKMMDDEPLPESISLTKEEVDDDSIEPDYTEDGEIESPILGAKIDLDLFDRAFEENTKGENDALDDLMADNAEDQETEEVDLLAEILEETNLEAKKEEDTESDSRFDALSSEMFGNEDKK